MDKTCSKAHNVGKLALRISVGIIFIMQGWGKLNGIEGVAGMLENASVPAPLVFAWILAITEFVGGIAVLLGVYVRLAAKLLVVIMVTALLLVHWGTTFAGSMAPIALLGSTIALLTLGGGDWVLTKKDCGCRICKCK